RKTSNALLISSEEDKSLLNGITNNIARKRYENILGYSENHRCRREYLLALLGAETEVCFGCDVCNGDVQTEPEGETAILKFISKNKRRLTLREARQALLGKMSFEVREKELWSIYGCGTLHTWNIDDIDEAIKLLITTGKLKLPKRGGWKHKLTRSRH
ncbi:MAG: RecQ family zinc-binding domain-containing protein, partial [Spirochaetota bacterium]